MMRVAASSAQRRGERAGRGGRKLATRAWFVAGLFLGPLTARGYVIHVGFGLASATKAVQLRGDTVREVFEIPAGGLRIGGKVGDTPIPPAQIAFTLFKGSQFEPGDKRPIVQSVQAGDLI